MIFWCLQTEDLPITSYLTLSERRIIAGMLHRKISFAQIAAQLGRHGSTIHREIRRNFWDDPEVPMAMEYWHMNAQHPAVGRRKRQAKLLRDDDLMTCEREGLLPGRPAGHLNRSPGGGGMKVADAVSAMKQSTAMSICPRVRRGRLPERRRKGKTRYARKPRCLVFPEGGTIGNRPKAVKDRKIFGAWEADLTIF